MKFATLLLKFPSGFSRQTDVSLSLLPAGFGDQSSHVYRPARRERRLLLQQGKANRTLPLRLHSMSQPGGAIQEFFLDAGELGRRVERPRGRSQSIDLCQSQANELARAVQILRSSLVVNRELFTRVNRIQYVKFFRRFSSLAGQFLPERYRATMIAASLRMLRQFAPRSRAMFGRQTEVEGLGTCRVCAVAIAALVQKAR